MRRTWRCVALLGVFWLAPPVPAVAQAAEGGSVEIAIPYRPEVGERHAISIVEV